LETRSGKDILDDDYEVIKLTKFEVARKSVGFQPTKVSEHWRQSQARRGVEKYWNDRRSNLVTAYTLADKQGNMKKLLEIENKIDKFHEKMPDYISPITGQTLRSRQMPYKSKRRSILKEMVQ
jgi:hypothetical protein